MGAILSYSILFPVNVHLVAEMLRWFFVCIVEHHFVETDAGK